MKYRLIVFDWDGTIIDSAATIAECIRDSARDMGLPVPSTERASQVIGATTTSGPRCGFRCASGSVTVARCPRCPS